MADTNGGRDSRATTGCTTAAAAALADCTEVIVAAEAVCRDAVAAAEAWADAFGAG